MGPRMLTPRPERASQLARCARRERTRRRGRGVDRAGSRRENAPDGKGTGGDRVRTALGRLGSARRRRVGGRQCLVRGRSRSRGDAGGPRRVELGCMVARRRRGGVRRPRARLPPLPPARGARERGANGHLARGRSARLSRRRGGGGRLAAAGRATARPDRTRARARLAGVPGGLHRPPLGRYRQGGGARRSGGRGRAAIRRPRPGDARTRAPGRHPRRLRAGRGGYALPRRGHRDRPGGRGDDPDLRRLGLLLPGQRLHRRARLRARV
jgi:hypothetical protein